MKYLLYPIAWLFAIIVYIRNALYDWNLLPSISSSLPIISVGNIQAGGTGKTPFVIALSKQLIENNIKPLIITRGYKRNTSHQIVLNNLEEYSAQEVGDEPYYIKQVLETVPIIIDYNKKNAVKAANQMQGIDCIILDDGFQSRYINKALDIVLVNTVQKKYPVLMPVGNLREPFSNLKRAHTTGIAMNLIDSELEALNPPVLPYTADFIKQMGKKWYYQKQKYYNKCTHLNFEYELHKYKNNNQEVMESITPKERCVAFCGIGNPIGFMRGLENIDKKIVFENHANYNSKKYEQLKKTNPNNLSFITTYKDFVKLDREFKSAYTIYVLEVRLSIDDEKLINQIKNLINEN